MKHNPWIGTAAIISSLAFVILSVNNATAFQSSTISLGSNPVFSTYVDNCSSTATSVTVPSDQVLVITDINSAAFEHETITISTTNSGILGRFSVRKHSTPYDHVNQGGYYFSTSSSLFTLRSGIVVPAGETVLIDCSQNQVTISGYYAQA